jgi:replicative DNA helicase
VNWSLVHGHLKDRKQLETASTLQQSAYDYLMDLGTAMVVNAVAEESAKRVMLKARVRASIAACETSLQDLFASQDAEAVERSQARVMAVKAGHRDDSTQDFGTAVEEALTPILAAHEGTAAPQRRAILTGLPELDRMVWVDPGDYTILAARTSDGKTALALQIILHVVNSGGRVLLHTPETQTRQLAMRYLAMHAEVSIAALREGRISPEAKQRLTAAFGKSLTLPFRVCDDAGITVPEIGASLRRELLTGGVDLLVIDHLLKVTPNDPRNNRHAQMTQISNDLFNLARKEKVATLGLYQLIKAQDDTKPPQLGDMRESGSVAEDADNVLMLHRPERTSITPATLYIRKARQGECGKVKLIFESAKTTFKQDGWPA